MPAKFDERINIFICRSTVSAQCLTLARPPGTAAAGMHSYTLPTHRRALEGQSLQSRSFLRPHFATPESSPTASDLNCRGSEPDPRWQGKKCVLPRWRNLWPANDQETLALGGHDCRRNLNRQARLSMNDANADKGGANREFLSMLMKTGQSVVLRCSFDCRHTTSLPKDGRPNSRFDSRRLQPESRTTSALAARRRTNVRRTALMIPIHFIFK